MFDDLSNHVKLKNSDKAKFKSAIKKLQSRSTLKIAHNESIDQKGVSTKDTILAKTAPTKNNSQIKPKSIEMSGHRAQVDDSSSMIAARDPNLEENKTDSNEKKECVSLDTSSDTEQPYTNDEMLNKSFECDHCGKTMSQCSLFYCTQCNSVADPEKRKYYCKKGLSSLHNDHIKCRDHKEQVMKDLKILTSSSNANASESSLYSGLVVKLTFDVAALKQKRDAGIESFEKSMVKYLNDIVSGNLHGMQASVASAPPLLGLGVAVKYS